MFEFNDILNNKIKYVYPEYLVLMIHLSTWTSCESTKNIIIRVEIISNFIQMSDEVQIHS